jgi:hypothetical protein
VAGFNLNQRRRCSGNDRQHLRASELSFGNGLSQIIDSVNLKAVLDQIQSIYAYPSPSFRSALILQRSGESPIPT